MSAWLDDLSEDWPSQPPSLNVSQTSRALGSSTSRLPRSTRPSGVSSSSAAASQTSRKTSRNVTNDSQRQRSILAERDHNQTSVNAGTSQHPKDRSLRKSLSTGSVQSNVMYSTVEVRSQPASPEKFHGQGSTPEWKRRLLHGDVGYGQQKDLFGPSGIQSLFQKPPEKLENQNKSNNLSFLKHLETIPSSPPGIPRAMPFGTSVDASISQRFSNLAILDEIEEDRASSRQSTQSHEEIHQPLSEVDDNSKAESLSESLVRIPGTQRITSLGVESRGGQSRTTSGETHNDSFSAVFISKHNTADGGIAYAPIDMSRSELAEQLALFAMSHNSRGERQAEQNLSPEDGAAEQPSVAHSEDLPTDLPVGTPDLVSIGEFVTVRRGGYSDDGSFKRRPLSPSPLKMESRSGMESSLAEEIEEESNLDIGMQCVFAFAGTASS
jgi:protein NUD1